MNDEELMQDERIKETIIESAMYLTTEILKATSRILIASTDSTEKLIAINSVIASDVAVDAAFKAIKEKDSP